MTFLKRLFGGEASIAAQYADSRAKRLYHLAHLDAHAARGILAATSPGIAQRQSSVAGEETLDYVLTVAFVTVTLAALAESGDELALRACTRRVFERVSTDARGERESVPHLARLQELWNANGANDREALSNHLTAATSSSHDPHRYRIEIGRWVLEKIHFEASSLEDVERLSELIGRIATRFAAQTVEWLR